MSYISYIFFF